MCIKNHTYYVCNCKNVHCPAKYTMCCPYGPSPDALSAELGHIMSNCKSTESACEELTKQQQQKFVCYPETCKDAKVELLREDIGLCWNCQVTCKDNQTGMTGLADIAALKNLREKEENEREGQMKEWKQSVDSDDEA